MRIASIAGACVAYVLAAVFITSGMSKLVIPRYAVAAILQLRLPLIMSGFRVVRLFALVEVAVGLGLALPYSRSLAPLAMILIGVAFVILGFLARLRQVTVGCGCFGKADEPGLGLRTIGAGLLVMVGALAIVLLGPQWSDPAPEAIAAMAVAVLLVTGMVNRKMLVELVPRPLANDQRYRSL